MIKPEAPEAQETADLLNNLILQSQEILKDHPVNLRRIAAGKDPQTAYGPGRRDIVRLCKPCRKCMASSRVPSSRPSI